MAGGAHDFHDIGERQDSFIGSGKEFRPVPHMLFGREEMNAASRIGPVPCPLVQRDVYVTAYCVRSCAFYFSVTHYHAHTFAAVQAGRIDLDRFSREDPADRQGFESSLGEPFLLSLDGDEVLRGQAVKRRE